MNLLPHRQYRPLNFARPCECSCTRLTRRRFMQLGAVSLPALVAPEAWAVPEPKESASAPADIIFHNGTVVTVNARNARVPALAVRGNKIIAVGGLGQVMAHRGKRTEMVDLRGGALLPGFVEPHTHTAFVPQDFWLNVNPLQGTKTIAAAGKVRPMEPGPVCCSARWPTAGRSGSRRNADLRKPSGYGSSRPRRLR